MQASTELRRPDEVGSASHSRSVAYLCALLVCISLLGWRLLVATFKTALSDEQYTHILLILPAFFLLLGVEWQGIKKNCKVSLGTGLPLLAVAGMLAAVAHGWLLAMGSNAALSLGMLAMVISWVGAFALCLGSASARRCLFSLGFLFALVPIPESFMDVIIKFFQISSAMAASALFIASQVPVLREGSLIAIPGLAVDVAPECSSVHSSFLLMVTTAVIAQLLLRSVWRKAALIVLAFPLSIAKNGLRIYTIAMLGTKVDRSYLTGRVHHDGGIVFFGIALLVIAVLLWALRRQERQTLAPVGLAEGL